MKNRGTISVSITDIPEALGGMRMEVARILRSVAESEEPAVRRRLAEVADAFEAGARPGALDADQD